jgi:hypothetical protein
MQFLKEIREHLANFETEASEEIHRFIDWLHTKYVEPVPAVPAPKEVVNVQDAPSFTPALDAAPAANTAPVVESVASVVDAPAQDAAVKE